MYKVFQTRWSWRHSGGRYMHYLWSSSATVPLVEPYILDGSERVSHRLTSLVRPDFSDNRKVRKGVRIAKWEPVCLLASFPGLPRFRKCIILNANRRTKMGEAWERGYLPPTLAISVPFLTLDSCPVKCKCLMTALSL